MKKTISNGVIVLFVLVFIVGCAKTSSENDGRYLLIYEEGVVAPYGCSYSWEVDLDDGVFTHETFPKESCEGYTEEETPQEFEMCARCDETVAVQLTEAELSEIESLIQTANLETHGDVEPAEGEEPCAGVYGTEVTYQWEDGINNTFLISGSLCDGSAVDAGLLELLNHIWDLDEE